MGKVRVYTGNEKYTAEREQLGKTDVWVVRHKSRTSRVCVCANADDAEDIADALNKAEDYRDDAEELLRWLKGES